MQDVFVDFNGTQIDVSTNSRIIAEYLNDSHRALVATSARFVCGRISVVEKSNAFECLGADGLDYSLGRDDAFDWLSRQILETFIRNHPQLLWLHSGCVTKCGKALLLAGAAAQGKSTLSSALANSGWEYFSDEVAPVRMNVDYVLPYPRTPHPRIHPKNQVEEWNTSRLPRELVSVERQAPDLEAHVTWIVFLKFHFGAATRLDRIGAGDAAIELIRNASNFFDHGGDAVERIGKLALASECYMLEYGDRSDAAVVLNAIAA